MSTFLSGLTANLFGRNVQLAPHAVAIVGQSPTGQPVPLLVGADGSQAGGSLPFGADYVSMNTPSKPTVITYKTGGSGGTTVATVTLTYTGDDVATMEVTLS